MFITSVYIKKVSYKIKLKFNSNDKMYYVQYSNKKYDLVE